MVQMEYATKTLYGPRAQVRIAPFCGCKNLAYWRYNLAYVNSRYAGLTIRQKIPLS